MSKLFYVLLLCIATQIEGFSQFAEITKIKNSFAGYKKAILINKGKEAASFLDSATITYYETVLTHCKTSDSATITQLTFFDRMMVLLVKHRTARDKILSFTGKDLLIYSIENGMVGKSSVATTSLGKVIITGNSAKGQVMANKKPSPIYLGFKKEATLWKLSLVSIFKISEKALLAFLKESEQTENGFIMLTLKSMNGVEPAANIWHPVK